LRSNFLSFKAERDLLIEVYKKDFKKNKGPRSELDTAKMIALLEQEKPKYIGWRQAEKNQQPFQSKSDLMCLKALQFAGIKTAEMFRNRLRKPSLALVLKKIKKMDMKLLTTQLF
jgi:hypothetical protein